MRTAWVEFLCSKNNGMDFVRCEVDFALGRNLALNGSIEVVNGCVNEGAARMPFQ